MSPKRRIFHYAVAYLLWVISTGAGILVLNLMRETVLLAIVVNAAASDLTPREKFYQNLQVTAVQTWSILVAGLLVLILLVWLESFYRTGAGARKLWKRFFLVSGIEFSALFLTHTIYFALKQSFGGVGWWGIAIPAVEALVAASFWWGYIRANKLPASAV